MTAIHINKSQKQDIFSIHFLGYICYVYTVSSRWWCSFSISITLFLEPLAQGDVSVFGAGEKKKLVAIVSGWDLGKQVFVFLKKISVIDQHRNLSNCHGNYTSVIWIQNFCFFKYKTGIVQSVFLSWLLILTVCLLFLKLKFLKIHILTLHSL